MKRNDAILLIVLAIITILIVLLCVFVPSPSDENTVLSRTSSPSYEKYFNPDEVTRVDIIIDEDFFNLMLNNAPEIYAPCNILLNGDEYKNVGIKIKGNFSKEAVEKSPTSLRYGFKIKADAFGKQSIAGLDSFVLNPEFLDATMVREYLSYEVLKKSGVKTPLYAFAAVYVNGEYWGLYLMVESIDQSFLKRNYGKITGNLYRPEGTKPYYNPTDDTVIGPDLSKGHRGGHLEYVGDSVYMYDEIFNNPVYITNDFKGKSNMMEIIRHLRDKSNPSKYINMDEIISYLAANSALTNYDSYFNQGETHNYCLYEDNGILTIFPWDCDLSLGIPFLGSSSYTVNLPIDQPLQEMNHSSSYDRLPLLEVIVTTPELKQKYHDKIRWIAENLMGEHMIQRIDEVTAMIYPYMEKDPHISFPVATYHEKAIDTLHRYVMLRTQSILDQLDGKIPTTYSEQKEHPELLIDTGDLDIKDMGSYDRWLELWS